MKKAILLFLFQITFSIFSLSQNIKHFDSGRGTGYERYIAKLALSCLTRVCYSDVLTEFKEKDFLYKRFKPNHQLSSELKKISDLIISELIKSKRRSNYLGYLNVLGEPNLTFTRTIYQKDKEKILAQIELKLYYKGGILKAKSIKLRDSNQFKYYEEWNKYLVNREKDENRNIPLPPPPPLEEEIIRFKDLISYPHLCDCTNNELIYVDENYKFYLKDKYQYNYLYRVETGRGSPTDFLVATLGSKKGLINYDNDILIPIKYQHIRPIGNKLFLLVKENGKYGVLSTKNDVIVPIKYDEIRLQYYFNYKTGQLAEFFIVILDGMFGVSNEYGEMILQPKYERVDMIMSRYFRVKRNNLYGVFSSDGSEIVPIIFEEIKSSNLLYLEVFQTGKKETLIPRSDTLINIRYFNNE